MKNMENFHSQIVKMANYLSLPHVKGEDGSAASPVGNLPCPRESLSSVIPTKTITEVISKCGRQLKVWLEVSAVLTSTVLLCRL